MHFISLNLCCLFHQCCFVSRKPNSSVKISEVIQAVKFESFNLGNFIFKAMSVLHATAQ